jgi:hypothetical protein
MYSSHMPPCPPVLLPASLSALSLSALSLSAACIPICAAACIPILRAPCAPPPPPHVLRCLCRQSLRQNKWEMSSLQANVSSTAPQAGVADIGPGSSRGRCSGGDWSLAENSYLATCTAEKNCTLRVPTGTKHQGGIHSNMYNTVYHFLHAESVPRQTPAGQAATTW